MLGENSEFWDLGRELYFARWQKSQDSGTQRATQEMRLNGKVNCSELNKPGGS